MKRNKLGQALVGVVALGAAYGVFSGAIDNGSWWFYLGAFLLLGVGIHFIRQIFKK